MLLSNTIIAALSLFGLEAYAKPGKKVIANFDDLQTLPGAEGFAVETPYKGLNFSGFSVGAVAPAAVVTLLPSSLKNFAFDSLLADHIITSRYQGSKVTSFDLSGLSTGCYPGTRSGVVAPPLNCTLVFTGTTKQGGQVKQRYNFGVGTANGIGAKSMKVQPVRFSKSFKDLTAVSVEVAKAVLPAGGGNTVQFAIDDVRYTLHA